MLKGVRATEMKLLVRKLPEAEMYRDIVRMAEEYRLDSKQRIVPEGNVCKIWIGNKQCLCLIRGIGDFPSSEIKMDERIRNKLGLSLGDTVEPKLEKVGFCGQFRWACTACDPAYRVSARLSALSVLLGLIGLLLGLTAFCSG